jgi:hypothetical protein
MKEPKYKHYFSIKDGKFIFEEKDMLQYKRLLLEGKRGYAIIEEEEEDITSNQYAYYFGGIIRKECMSSNTFSGLSDKEVHQVLFNDLRSTTKGILMPNGTTRLLTITDDFTSYRKKEMTKYIEELIPWLAMEYNIHVKPASHYAYNRFYFNPKILK